MRRKSIFNYIKNDFYLYNINNTLENNILYPIDINRLCKNKCLQKEKILSNISPLYILEKNEELKEKLYVTKNFRNNKIIQILIDIHLNPKLLNILIESLEDYFHLLNKKNKRDIWSNNFSFNDLLHEILSLLIEFNMSHNENNTPKISQIDLKKLQNRIEIMQK